MATGCCWRLTKKFCRQPKHKAVAQHETHLRAPLLRHKEKVIHQIGHIVNCTSTSLTLSFALASHWSYNRAAFHGCSTGWHAHAYLLVIHALRRLQQDSEVAAKVTQALGSGMQALSRRLLQQHVHPLAHKGSQILLALQPALLDMYLINGTKVQ